MIRSFFNSFSLPSWCCTVRAKASVLGLVVLTGTGYIFETNALTTSGYVIHKLEKQVATEEAEIDRLKTEVASYQSMASIQARLSEVALVPANRVAFKHLPADTAVAKR